MKQKSRKEIEDIGLRFLREHSDKKLLSNVNLDCFCHGYEKCQKEIMSHPGYAVDFLEWCMKEAGDRIDFLNDRAGYGGRCLTDDERTEVNILCNFRRRITDTLSEQL